MLNYAHRFTLAANTGNHANRILRLLILIVIGCLLFPAGVQGRDWPMWRYDAGRRAASPDQLPSEMYLQWVRELAPPKPAWPESQYKLRFDASYEPVVAGQTIFVGSMVADSVTAYDTRTGREKWRFYSDAPVRFAPVVYKDKLYFACDDGCLYCLSAKNGSLIRKFQAGPSSKKVLGNDRLIGMWPMRGGPVLYEDKIYFAAGIWPFMGIFIYAIDAETGEIVWENTGSGSTFTMQPHSSPAFAGVAPQGYMVATKDKLLVSGGRSVPAAYDRHTGQFLYYHMNKYGKAGTSEAIASGAHFFNRGVIHKLSDGLAVSAAPASVIDGDVIIGKKYDSTITAYKLGPEAKKAQQLWQTKAPSGLDKIHIKAGSRLYCSGNQGAVFAVEATSNDGPLEISWQAKVDGQVWTMLAADGRLFVTTTDGKLYCFSGERIKTQHHARKIRRLEAGPRRGRRKIREVSKMTGQDDGYCLMLGLGTGELLYQLLTRTQLHVIALDPDADKVAAMRRRLDDAGLYGTRAAVHTGKMTTMQLPAYMANLIVAENLNDAGFDQDNDFASRVFHSLRPYGGAACFFTRKDRRKAFLAHSKQFELPGCKVASSGLSVTLTRKGPLPGSADWTHQYGDSTNAVMSRDKSVKAPLGLLWFGGPSNDKILPRHGHGPSPHVVAGRLFIEGRNMLRAVDVYTGRLLWETQFQDLGKFYDNTSHQPGANEIGSNYVSVPDAVYVVYGDKIHVLDPATGASTKEFDVPGRPQWGSLLVWEDLLLAPASPLSIPLKEHHVPTDPPEGLEPIIEKGADWRYMAGRNPGFGWMQQDFDAGAWDVSAAGFGYSDDDDNTVLEGMRGRYSVVYIRKSFEVSNIENIRELGLMINYDDAFIAFLNGKEVVRVGVGRGSGARASGIDSHEAEGYEYFRIFEHSDLLREGVNVLAIEGHNDSIGSSDLTLDPYLVAVPNGGKPREKLKLADLADVPGVAVNADYSSGSKMLVAMDRRTGEVLWKRRAKYSFRHNAIVAADGKVFCIDGMTELKLAYLKRRGLDLSGARTIYALDARKGQLLWKCDEDVFGTWLAYSTEHGILLQAGSASGDRARDEVSRGMVAYRGSDGKVLWKTDDGYKGPPILYHDRVVTQTGGGSSSAAAEAKVFDLFTGEYVMRTHPMTHETIPWTWVRFKGCNTAVASENLLTFRSASGAFVDLTSTQGTASIGGFKSGCTSNLIIANGVLNAPDYTRTCICSYQNQASLALVHSPEVAYWTFDYYRAPSEVKPVKQVGINLGAPGNRYAENGTLWLEFPSVGGPSPDIPVRAKYQEPRWIRHHNSRIDGEQDWIAASGVAGVREVAVRMFIQPGSNPSSVDAFDKHIEKIPTWSEDQIKGTFKRPRPYTVRLYFAEIAGCQVGQRLFDVSLQGEPVLVGFDIAKEAGGTNRPVVRQFKGIGIKDDLRITLTPTAATAAQPLLNGIEIIAEDM